MLKHVNTVTLVPSHRWSTCGCLDILRLVYVIRPELVYGWHVDELEAGASLFIIGASVDWRLGWLVP